MSDGMHTIVNEMAICSAFYSNHVHSAVAQGTGLRTEARRAWYCGRFYVDDHWEVSVSVPPDASGNRARDHPSSSYRPQTIETMLVLNGELKHDSIQRFNSVPGVIRYINNLKNRISGAAKP